MGTSVSLDPGLACPETLCIGSEVYSEPAGAGMLGEVVLTKALASTSVWGLGVLALSLPERGKEEEPELARPNAVPGL